MSSGPVSAILEVSLSYLSPQPLKYIQNKYLTPSLESQAPLLMSQVDYCSNYRGSLVTGILISTSAHFNLLSAQRVIFLKHKSDHVTPTQNSPTGFPAHLE